MFASSYPPPPAELRNKNIVLLIGHPDDEAMFFGPSLIAMVSPVNRNRVRIICLSNGNAVGLGKTRERELLNSALRLGIRSDEDVYVKDDLRFQDGAQNDWKKEDIAEFLSQRFAPHTAADQAAATSSLTSDQRSEQRLMQPMDDKAMFLSSSIDTPDVIVTFDPQGISSHPNHSACYHGAVHFVTCSNNQPTRKIALYTLTSISIFRKYISVLDAPISLLLSSLQLKPGATTAKADRVLFVSGLRDYARAFGAMVLAHKTQMVWFRWGWIITGRYMVVNDLKREMISP